MDPEPAAAPVPGAREPWPARPAAGARERLVAVVRVYRERGSDVPADRRYALYVAVLVVVIVGVPAVRALVLLVAQPDVLTTLRSPGAPRVSGVVAGLLLAGFAMLGQVRGPALLPPFFVSVLAGNDLPRRRTLLAPFVVAAGWTTFAVTATTALLALTLAAQPVGWFSYEGSPPAPAAALDGSAATASALLLILCAASVGVLAGVLWLAGQRVGPHRSWVLPLVAAVCALAPVVAPATGWVVPSGWFSHAWAAATVGAGARDGVGHLGDIPTETLVATTLLVALACVAAGLVPRLLDALAGPRVLEQARRWSSLTVAAGTGDLVAASERLQVPPRGFARRWRAVHEGPSWVQTPLSGLVGALRTPGRLVAGGAWTVASGVVLAAAVTLPGPLRWWCAAVVGLTAFLATGPTSDGLRHAAESASGPALYGYRTGGLLARHAVLPAVLTMLLGALGVVLGGRASGAAFAADVVLVLLVVLVRAHRSARGGLPPGMLVSVPTPLGDLSGAVVLLWNLDWALLSVLAGLLSVAVVGSGATGEGAVSPAALAASLALLLVLWTRARLRR